MSAKKLLDLIERSGVLSETVIADLREQVADKRTTAAAIAKLLVDKGYLTRFQATKLVSEATERASKNAESGRATPSADDELRLAPIDDDEQDEDDGVVMLEDAGDALTPVEDAGAGLTPVGEPTGLDPLAPSDSLDDLLSGEPGVDLLGDFGQHQAVTAPKRPLPGSSVWESKLMFGGGLALALLIISFAVLYVNLSATPAIEMWDAAMEHYRSEAYSRAQASFEEFLHDYPDHERASEGRVRVALCKIRVALGDPQKSLDRSREELPRVETETDFSVGRDELARILIQIPQGFVQQAKNADRIEEKIRLVALAEAGMDLVNNPSYVPSSRRSAVQGEITRVIEEINLIHRDIDQDEDLARAIDEINAFAAAGQTPQAYEVYKALIKKYPGLAHDAELIAAVKEVTARERDLVRAFDEPLAAVAEDLERPSDIRLVLANRSGEIVERFRGQTVTLLAEGAAYALDVGSGQLLWSRFVGHHPQSQLTRVSRQADADVLLADLEHQALLRLDARSGKVIWRLPLEETFAPPVVHGRSLYLSTSSGRLLELNSETGSSSRQVRIPQPLDVGTVVAPNRPNLFQVGRHSNLYVLSTETLGCEDVFYLGHKEGAIATPPLVHLGHLFVAENAGQDHALLHVLAIRSDDERTMLSEEQPPIRLRGQVRVPLELYGRRVLAVTDRGAVAVLDVDVNSQPPARLAASLPPTLDEPMISYPLTDAQWMWIASDRLAKYRVQVITGEVSQQDISNAGDTFVALPQLFGDVLVHVRRPEHSPGVVVAAIQIDNPRQALWQTHLGVPALPVVVDRQRESLRVVSAAGSLHEITSDELKNGYVDQPTSSARTLRGAHSFTEPIALSAGRVALFNPVDSRTLAVYDSGHPQEPVRTVALDLPEGEITSRPVSMGVGVLVPLSNGEVHLVDVESGIGSHKPFRPRLEPGEQIQWRGPAVLSEREFVAADDRRQVYRVVVSDQPAPHLMQAAAKTIDFDFTSDLEAYAASVFGIVRTAGTDVLVALDAADLTVTREVELQGTRATWGPKGVGDALLVVTDDRQVFCVDQNGLRWPRPAEAHGRPAGPPLADGSDFIFAAQNGVVWRIDGETGEEIVRVDVGLPLACGPRAFGSRLLLCGLDGTLHIMRLPDGP